MHHFTFTLGLFHSRRGKSKVGERAHVVGLDYIRCDASPCAAAQEEQNCVECADIPAQINGPLGAGGLEAELVNLRNGFLSSHSSGYFVQPPECVYSQSRTLVPKKPHLFLGPLPLLHSPLSWEMPVPPTTACAVFVTSRSL